MEIVAAGLPIPIEYSAYDQSPDLVVAMLVYDVTAGYPGTLASTVVMTHIINGTYGGTFTPQPNKIYVVNKMVYTSLTLLTTDSSYSPGSESFASNTFYACEMAAAIDPAFDILTFQVWLEQNREVVANPQTAEVNVFNSLGAPIVIGLMSSTPSSQGVFTLTFDHASNVFAANQAYTVTVSIGLGPNIFETTKALTVF
jgi:hypothetical protein